MFRLLLFIFIISSSRCCLASSNYYDELFKPEEFYLKNKFQSQFAERTKDALLSYDYIEDRADYLVFKLKKLTFGEYSDHVLYLAPLVTGKVEINAYRVNIYYDSLASKGGIKYKVKF